MRIKSPYPASAMMLAALLLLAANVHAQGVLEAPHQDVTSPSIQGCLDCHDVTAIGWPKLIPEPPGWIPRNPVTLENEFTIFNLKCWECHNGGVPVTHGNPPATQILSDMKTHSSLTTSTKYGEWAVGCTVCHNPHSQGGQPGGKFIWNFVTLDNIEVYGGKAAKSGRKTVVFDGQTVPNSFADGDATYNGICEVCHTETTYHQNNANGDHTHNLGFSCISCHPHDQGFSGVDCGGCHDFPPGQLVFNPVPTGSSTAGAHTVHTGLNYSCQYCHNNSVGSGPAHNNGDNAITMGFSLFNGSYQGGAYDGQASANYDATGTVPATTVTKTGGKICSNLYCHGTLPDGTNWGGGTNTNPAWDGTVSCGDCHRTTAASAPTRGSHTIHTQAWASWGNPRGNQYPCSYCHTDPAVDTSLHANNSSEVVFSDNPMTRGGIYNGNDDMLGTYGTCSTLYCHSTVQSSPPGNDPEYRAIPQWGTTKGGCDHCHYSPTSAPALVTGSHAKHWPALENIGYMDTSCFLCHNYDSVDDECFGCHENGDPSKSHANGNIEVRFLPMIGSSSYYSGTSQPGDAYGSCTNTYCHSDGKSGGWPALFPGLPVVSAPIQWDGQTPDPQGDGFSCNNCHQYPPTNDSHEVHVTTQGYGCSSCHAVTTQDNITINIKGNFYGDPAHLNTIFDLNPSGQFWDESTSQFIDINFTYTPMTVSGNEGGRCAGTTCHQTSPDPIRWLYQP